MCLIRCLVLNGHLYFRGVYLNVNLRTDTIICWTEIGLCVQDSLTILDAIVNIIWGGALYIRLLIQESLHFGNDLDIHMSSENFKESGHRHDLDLLVILQ